VTRDDDAWFNTDEKANEIERRAGIAEPRQVRGSVLRSIILPCLVFGVFLILVFWWIIQSFHLLG